MARAKLKLCSALGKQRAKEKSVAGQRKKPQAWQLEEHPFAQAARPKTRPECLLIRRGFSTFPQ
ncbi:hypothetical protein ALP26_102743 [Pseudomonas savastanoi pv. glycinea]|uniref:Uncharacterized protein n=11 Tax=Pseudomonas TaxID=286 RepID=A0A0N8T1R0_PSEAJ|nr:hypothetical protein ALO51_101952 [Pseudomonas amygdali]KPW89061.1 hypothetical protein ALO50_102425 [Pseudomonas syringae pv. cerasicola]KPX06282.1 hypothetical protein ALO73_102174 [Pseudomonas syringae pv. daphniphylli]KPX38590.1 hypothetical protein ALO69_102255 [Pseudomonas ficuserectae]KPX43704.1 hypothetical protein ALO37_102102 [Pseudomonas savastanoi pv. glycinea]KPX56222.1 hypothetical protein ALO67_101594 [Pseudomonas amygdali pv. hibisci]KPX76601.1 hypothetical protein ALO35_10